MKNPVLAALSQKSLSVGIVASAVFFGTTSHALASVLIAGADDASLLNDVQAKIAGTGLISGSVDVLDVSSSTPTLAQLQAYDAVLSFSDAPFADPTTFGNVLADYVDAGGGVVQSTFSFYNHYNYGIGGRWRAQNYDVWQPGGQNQPGNLTLGTIYDPSNPILAGVTSFNGGSASFYNTVGSLNPGAVAVADWSNGVPLIAVNTSTFAGKIAGLNFYPPSSDARSDFWLSSTDGARLMANSLNFVTPVPEPLTILGTGVVLGALPVLKKEYAKRNKKKDGKEPSGKIIFLETGKGGERGSGLLHILENHREDFLKRGITEAQIPDLIIRDISEGKIIGIQGKSRIIYQVEINEMIQYISLEISHNGYLVSANPTPTRLINKLIQE